MAGFDPRKSLALWRAREKYRKARHAYWENRGNAAKLAKWSGLLKHARHMIDKREHPPVSLHERAYQEASRLVGVMEQGGNNVGAQVEQIIREGGGLRGQAWCGWFCAAVYKRAGSKAVTWQWGAVRLYVPLSGIRVTSSPQRGDLVRFTFDHVGMFVRFNADGSIQTIEGNTGGTGAVSDSKTGGDGVYRKNRPRYMVRDFLRIER